MKPIVIIATIDVQPAFKKTLLDFMNSGLITQSRAESGNIQYDLHQDQTDPNKLIMIELWASKEAIEAHNASEHFQAFVRFVEGKLNQLDIKQMIKIL